MGCGGGDYILKMVATDIYAYQRLINAPLDLDVGIARYFSYIITKTVKEDSILPMTLFQPNGS